MMTHTKHALGSHALPTAALVALLSFGIASCQEGGPLDLVSEESGLTLAKPGGGKGKPGSEPTAVVTITTSIPGAGLYGDGGGTYSGTFSGGNLWISPSCEEERVFRLDLVGEGLDAPFNEPVDDCGFPPRLTIETGLLDSAVGDILGGPVPAGSKNMSAATNYYFEDANGTTYNVIWQAGIRVTSVSAPVDNGDGTSTTTYGLSTEPGLADDADLVKRLQGGGKNKPGTEPVGDGDVTAHLELTVEVTQ